MSDSNIVDFIMDILSIFRQISLKSKLAILLGSLFVIKAVIQIVFFPSSVPFGPVEAGNLLRWESQLGKFSIDYPENWIAHDLPQGDHGDIEVIALILANNNWLPQVYISQKDFSPSQINDVASWGEVRDQSRGNYKSLKSENISTANIVGQTREYTIIFDSLLGATEAHCLDLYTLNNQRGYQFSFCADEKDWAKMSPVFHEMIRSLVISQ